MYLCTGSAESGVWGVVGFYFAVWLAFVVKKELHPIQTQLFRVSLCLHSDSGIIHFEDT